MTSWRGHSVHNGRLEEPRSSGADVVHHGPGDDLRAGILHVRLSILLLFLVMMSDAKLATVDLQVVPPPDTKGC